MKKQTKYTLLLLLVGYLLSVSPVFAGCPYAKGANKAAWGRSAQKSAKSANSAWAKVGQDDKDTKKPRKKSCRLRR